MEKAILKTLIYAALFDYPLKVWEIHKWLIGKQANLKQVEKSLKSKNLQTRVKCFDGYYFLSGKQQVKRRLEREKHSEVLLRRANLVAQTFKVIPWVKLVGVSGSVSMKNAAEPDDIDFFIITEKKRLWLSRLLLLLIIDTIGIRRRKGENEGDVAGKACINLLLETGSLAQSSKNIYIAHEVLQMRVLWQREGVYQRFLEENAWAFKYLPNWITGQRFINHPSSISDRKSFLDKVEAFAEWVQIKVMGQTRGLEKIWPGALYFHPEDQQNRVLPLYQKSLKRFKIEKS